MEKEKNNLDLWNKVEKTNPKYTKNAKVGGNKITAISPQYQIMQVTEQFGPYGINWGFKNIEFDFTLVESQFMKDVTEGSWPNIKVVGKESANMGMVVFKATFFYPNGEFPIVNSISLFTNNDMSKLDDQFAKKVETDTLTKAISKLGFNADIFMGKFDDQRYVEELKEEFAEPKEEESLVPELIEKLDLVELYILKESDLKKWNGKIYARDTIYLGKELKTISKEQIKKLKKNPKYDPSSK